MVLANQLVTSKQQWENDAQLGGYIVLLFVWLYHLIIPFFYLVNGVLFRVFLQYLAPLNIRETR